MATNDIKRSLLRRFLGAMGWLGLLVGVVCLVAGRFGHLAWWLELVGHLRVHTLLGLCVCLLLFALARARRGLVLGGIVTLITFATVVRWWIPIDRAHTRGSSIRLVHSNVLGTNTSFDEHLEELWSLGGDVIGLVETNPRFMERVSSRAGWTVVESWTPRVGSGIALLVRDGTAAEVRDARVFDLAPGSGNLPSIEATLIRDGATPVRLLYLHAASPRPPGRHIDRDQQLDGVARWVLQQDDEVVVLGDLNATVWNPSLQAMMSVSDLSNSLQGFGMDGSWPAFLPGPLRVGIDHALHTRGLVTLDRMLGDASGSDHLPLMVEIASTVR